MEWISDKIVNHKKTIVLSFLIVLVVSAFLALHVNINYNMMEYLPENANSTKAIDLMKENFDEGMPNTSVMVSDVNISQALEYKDKLSQVEGVSKVEWLDDSADITMPIETLDKDIVDMYYKNQCALFSVTIEDGEERATVNRIYDVVGEKGAVTETAAEQASSQNLAISQAMSAIMMLAPLIIIILILSTTSWIEPFLYLTTIGIAVIINLGLQFISGEMSYVTLSVAPILQLAVSLDYAVFLSHSYQEHLLIDKVPNLAMKNALKSSFKAIFASAATTFFGFIALMFMDFKIGPDMGIALVRGVALSFVSVMVFLPALMLMVNKWIAKTQHRKFIPDFKNIGNFLNKTRIPVLMICILLLVPCYLGQKNNNFTYGSGEPNPESRLGEDIAKTEEVFEPKNMIAMMVPVGDSTKEKLLSDDLEKIDHVVSVMSYANTVSNKIPTEYLSEDVVKNFYSDKYSRIIINVDTPTEGDIAFETVENVKSAAEKYYGEEVYMCGQSVNMYDMKETIENDNKIVDLITIVSIFIILLIEFKSLILPFILIITIKVAIWINMSIPYFLGGSMVYIGYMVVSTVMMGATIDYAILLTDHYMEHRKYMLPIPAMKKTWGSVVKSTLVSSLILCIAGFALSFMSSEAIVKVLGKLLGRGSIIAFILSMTLLPALLILFDKLIPKLTWKANFYNYKK